MSPELIVKISNDPKLFNYLRTHSYWYKMLNRSKEYYKDFYNSYKANNRNEKVQKANKVIDTLSTVNTIFKIMR